MMRPLESHFVGPGRRASPTYVIRLRSKRELGDIHSLRAVLKVLLRRHGWVCLEVREEGRP